MLQFPETTAAAAAATAAGGSLSPFSSQPHGKAQNPAASQKAEGAGGKVGPQGYVQAACQVVTGVPGWFARASLVLSLVELL